MGHRFQPLRLVDGSPLMACKCGKWYDHPVHHPEPTDEDLGYIEDEDGELMSREDYEDARDRYYDRLAEQRKEDRLFGGD